MQEFDIRAAHNYTNIRFTDVPNADNIGDIVSLDKVSGVNVWIGNSLDPDGSCIGIQSEEDARNLINALTLAIENKWFE